MSFRTASITGLVMLAMIAGERFLLIRVAFSAAADVHGAYSGDSAGRLPRLPTASQLPETFRNQVFRTVGYLMANRELLLYGATAVFGLIMVVLVIASASSPPGRRNDAVVDALRQEKEKAEHLAQLKSEFLNQVSHELRTPLAVIIGYVECMTDGLYGHIEAKHHEILQVVAKQSTHLKNMIDQILIFSRLESNKQALRIEQISLNKLLSDLAETFDFLCRQKGLEFRLRLADRLPAMESDAERLKEILSNLLQNAVKYTDNGSIAMRVEHLLSADSVLFEISDTGMGIPQHYLATIFEPFIQVHKTPSGASRGGIGLGLSIVKKHIEQLKGTITVESEVAIGSTFRIVLPRVFEKRQARRNKIIALLRTGFGRNQKRVGLDNERTRQKPQPAHRAGQEL